MLTQFAQGYAVFTHIFLIFIVVGFISLCVKAVKDVNAENKAKQIARNRAIVANLLKKIGVFEVTYDEKYNAYYVFDSETGAFVTQNENPVILIEYLRDDYISYTLNVSDENTLHTMHASIKKIMSERKEAELINYGVQEV